MPVIAPRPIAFVSTQGPSGAGNLAPFSYFTMGGSSPQSLVFCPLLSHKSDRKDTLRTMVKPPRVAESPVNMECRLLQIVRHGERPLASNYVIGEVVAVHVKDAVLVAGIPDVRRIAPVTRLGGDDWGELTEQAIFTMARPR